MYVACYLPGSTVFLYEKLITYFLRFKIYILELQNYNNCYVLLAKYHFLIYTVLCMIKQYNVLSWASDTNLSYEDPLGILNISKYNLDSTCIKHIKAGAGIRL